MITYILAVARGYMLPTRIIGAGDHRRPQMDILHLIKYTRVIFMLKNGWSEWVLSILMRRANERSETTFPDGDISRRLVVMVWIKLNTQVTNQYCLIKHEDVLLSIKMCRPLLELADAAGHLILEKAKLLEEARLIHIG